MTPHGLEQLKKEIKGELLTDKVSRGIYATDASMYQVEPLGVVLPKDTDDLQKILAFAREHRVPILPRAGGTSLAGQTINRALVVDMSKYFRKIIEFRPEEKWVRVEPGIVLDELNTFLQPHGLQFAPDPATSSRCGIGGMIANNSSGTKSILYGKTIDHILGLKVLLSDLTELDLSACSAEEYDLIVLGDDRKAVIYRRLRELIFANADEIRQRFPKTLRRVSGYPLDAFVDESSWNIARLFAGSEGTLGIVTEARLNLIALPKHKAVTVVHFHNLADALSAVQHILPHRPAAVELLNEDVLELSKRNVETRKALNFLAGNPAALLLVEFFGESEDEMQTSYRTMVAELQSRGLGYAYPFYPEGPIYRNVWQVRKKGLGILMGMPADRKPLAFIEDAAVPVEHLPRYIGEMIDFCSSIGVKVAAYAHASVGVIHLRPFLNLNDPGDVKKIRIIAETAFAKVQALGGSWSSEHGDGLSRGEFISRFYGETIYGIFREIKDLFDPDHILNPERIVDTPPMDSQLRQGGLQLPGDFTQEFIYREQVDFSHALLQCTGIGVCRKTGTGTMCPSYMATMDEEHSTRGRANALRMAIEGNIDLSIDERLEEVFDLCLSCKACKTECPSNVDMARLKSELLQYKYSKHRPGLRERVVGDSVVMAKQMSGSLAGIVNPVQDSSAFRWVQDRLMGIDRRRKLPHYARTTFEQWYRTQQTEKHTDNILLFADSYMNYYEPNIGKAIINVLNAFDVFPALFSGYCCQRPRISNGFLRKAKKAGRELVSALLPYLQEGKTLVVCEPSCHSALVDDLPDLIESEGHVNLMNTQIITLEEYVASLFRKHGNPGLKINNNKFLLHGHCHQKALQGTDTIHEILNAFSDIDCIEPDSGCCGMAGAFGYEKGHYDLSGKIGERILFPAIRHHDEADVIASGFSCRHQIRDFTGRGAKHWIEIFKTGD